MADFVSIWDAPRDDASFHSLCEDEPAIDEPAPVPEPVCEPDPEPSPEPPPDIEALVAAAEKRGRERALIELAPRQQEAAREIEQLRAVAQELGSLRARILQDASAEIAGIVLGVARRVLGDALVLHPDALQNVVTGAVGRFPDPSCLTVRVAPDDVERVGGWLPSCQVLPDPSISGGCAVEAESGQVEASLETVMEGLETAVADWLAEQATA